MLSAALPAPSGWRRAAGAADPAQDARALRGRGLAYLQVKRWSLAAADFEAARQVAPDDPDNWVDLGVSLAGDNQIYPALEVFDTLLTCLLYTSPSPRD